MNRLAALIAVLIAAAPADGALITFAGLTGANNAAFTTYTEAGFVVAATDGSWRQAQNYGNPVPAIFSASSTGTIAITQVAPGQFTFSAVDLANGSTASNIFISYSILGTLGAASEFTIAGSLGPNPDGSFTNVANGNPSAMIDRLTITLTIFAGSSYTVDNIAVSPAAVPPSVPEPGSATMVAVGTAGLLARLRRRTA